MLYSVKQITLHRIFIKGRAKVKMDIRLVKLYDIYSPLLSDRQREIMDLYYNEDESLSEIAENTGITRQGVRDWIKKTESQLAAFETALGLAEKTEQLKNTLSEARNAVSTGETDSALELISKAEALI